MPSTPRYLRAPITEALIDLRVELPPKVAISDLERLESQLPDYPKKFPHIEISMAVEPGKTTNTQMLQGYLFRNTDDKQIVQYRMNGFTFSRLTPYDTWETFSAEAKRLWTIYRTAMKPVRVSRLAVRYINRIDMPLPLDDFGKYLQATPDLPDDLPGSVSGFFLQLQLPQDDIKSMLWFNEAVIPPPNESVVSVLLDFDLFRTAEIPEEEEALWAVFEEFRTRKNEVFEACITDHARRLFDGA